MDMNYVGSSSFGYYGSEKGEANRLRGKSGLASIETVPHVGKATCFIAFICEAQKGYFDFSSFSIVFAEQAQPISRYCLYATATTVVVFTNR